jgi:hypothetical protein
MTEVPMSPTPPLPRALSRTIATSLPLVVHEPHPMTDVISASLKSLRVAVRDRLTLQPAQLSMDVV